MKLELTARELLELHQLVTTHLTWLMKDLPDGKDLPPKAVRLFALLNTLSSALD